LNRTYVLKWVEELREETPIYARRFIPKRQPLPWRRLQNSKLFLSYKSEETVSLGAIAALQYAICFYSVCFCLLLVSLAIFTGRTLGTDAAIDPFAAEADFIPGAPRPTDAGFQCQGMYEYPQPGDYFYCIRSIPNDAVLRWVSVSGSNGVISRTSFGVRLRYGDLVALFGRAERISGKYRVVILRWSGIQAYVSVPRGSRLTLQSRVNHVAFFTEEARNS
jgi:hypothetical protein